MSQPNGAPLRVLRPRKASDKCGLSISTMYRRARLGIFPKPIALSSTASGWLEGELDAWLEERIAERDQDAGADGFGPE